MYCRCGCKTFVHDKFGNTSIDNKMFLVHQAEGKVSSWDGVTSVV